MGYISPRNRYNNPLPQKGERHQQFRSETLQNVTTLSNLKQLKESWLQLSSLLPSQLRSANHQP